MAYYFSYDIKGLYNKLEKFPEKELLYIESYLHSTMLYINEDFKEENELIKFSNKKTTIKDIEIWNTENNNFYLVAVLNDAKSELKKVYEELKVMTNTIDKKDMTFHVSLQKSKTKEELVNPEKLKYLIGTEIELCNFKCLLPKGKPIKLKL